MLTIAGATRLGTVPDEAPAWSERTDRHLAGSSRLAFVVVGDLYDRHRRAEKSNIITVITFPPAMQSQNNPPTGQENDLPTKLRNEAEVLYRTGLAAALKQDNLPEIVRLAEARIAKRPDVSAPLDQVSVLLVEAIGMVAIQNPRGRVLTPENFQAGMGKLVGVEVRRVLTLTKRADNAAGQLGYSSGDSLTRSKKLDPKSAQYRLRYELLLDGLAQALSLDLSLR
jgi:hypothetical protein